MSSFFNKLLTNFILSSAIFFLGGLGILIARIVKKNWSSHSWTWIPIFWIPFLSWPASCVVLFGGFDESMF
jgi:hypothetical protein